MGAFDVLPKDYSQHGVIQVTFGEKKPVLDVDINELQRTIQEARAEIIRQTTHSGLLSGTRSALSTTSPLYLKDGIATYDSSKNFPNYIEMRTSTAAGQTKDIQAVINGYILQITGTPNPLNGIFDGIVGINLPTPPTFGLRDDIVFIEAWFAEVKAGDPIYKYGGVDCGVLENLAVDSRVGVEATRRVQLRWRIRTVAGVDFSRDVDSVVKKDSAGNMAGWTSTLQPQGGNAVPLTYSLATFQYGYSQAVAGAYNINHNWNNSDSGLWIAGDGTAAAKTALATFDGYVYAIPLFRVKRRNNAGYRVDNLNGAVDYTGVNAGTWASFNAGDTKQITLASSVVSFLKVGTSLSHPAYSKIFTVISVDSTTTVTIRANQQYSGTGDWTGLFVTSDRPDGKYANIIDQTDIVDLRHRVSLTGFNYETVLEDTFDKLIRGELQTKDSKNIGKERYSLHRAPNGVSPQLMSVKVKGDDSIERDLINLLGSKGACNAFVQGDYANSTVSIASDSMGTYGRYTSTAAGEFGFAVTLTVDPTKNYLIMGDAFKVSGSFTQFVAKAAKLDWTPLKSKQISSNNVWTRNYLKVASSDLQGQTSIKVMISGYGSAAIGDVLNVDNVCVYEIDQATYDKIDVDPTFTGSSLYSKFPYISSYLNIVENLLDTSKMVSGRAYDGMFPASSWSVTPNTITIGQAGTMVSQRISLKPNTDYTVQHEGLVGVGSVYIYTYSGTDLNPSSRNSPVTFNTGSGTTDFVIGFYVPASGVNVPATFLNPRIQEKANVTPWYVPSGRWNMPYDIMNGDTKLRYEPYQQNRKIISDRQITDTITEIVDNLRTPQRHITVTQATEGQWAAGDKISISSEEGVITGVIDSDTALARIISGSGQTITVDDVTKLSVGDTFYLMGSANNGMGDTSNVRTVSAVDTTNKIITFTGTGVGTLDATIYNYVVETTASSSSPVVTSTGIAGTWSGLGTKLATYTITTPPTTNTDKIKIQYSVSYPAGKGIQQVADMYEVRVNGQRHVKSSDGTITIKANFEGKISGNTDRISHKAYRSSSASLAVPPSFSPLTEFISGSEYVIASKQDGTYLGSGGNGGTLGNIGQMIFSFDIIRSITDRLGNEVFADCITLADKVAKAKTIVSKIAMNWCGFGSSVGGYKATISQWYPAGNSWNNPITSGASSVTKVTSIRTWTAPIANDRIDDNGFVHFIVYADAAGNIADPTTAPTLALVANAGSTLTAQTYYVKYTWVNASGETMGSTEASIAVTAGNNLQINVPAFPANVTSAKVYVGTATGAETLQGTLLAGGSSSPLVISTNLVTGAALPSSNTTAIIASAINTDYVELELGLTPAETGYDVYSPENLFPVRVEALYQEGENMIPPFSEWSLSSLSGTVINSQYSAILASPTIDYQTVFVDVPVVALGNYTLIPYTLPTGFYAEIRQYNTDGSTTTIVSNITAAKTFTVPIGVSKIRVDVKNLAGIRNGGTLQNMMLTPGSKVYPFVPLTRNRKSKRTFDFLGKYGGSTWENPHRASTFTGALATTPSYQTNRADWDAATPQSSSQYLYDQVSKQDGTIKSSSSANPGTYAQHMFEFDLSHLGLSLSELKRLIRKITINWTGYGSGDNGGVVTNGATVKAWHEPTQAWTTTAIGNTASVPTFGTGTYSDNAGSLVRITKDQKIYVLVHSTYPSTASTGTIPSIIYTDYVSLTVELSEEVDFIKGNIVKVMKETKEFKTEYPMLSYTNGVFDSIELHYAYVPYQGTGNVNAHTVLTKPEKAILTTIGTGSARPSDVIVGSYFVPIPQLPLGTGLADYLYTYEKILFIGQYDSGATFDKALQMNINTEELLHASSTVYKGTRIGDVLTPTGSAKRGMLVTNTNRLLRRIKQGFSTIPSNMLAVIPYLALIDGEIYLAVVTAKPLSNNNVSLDGTSICAIDLFRLPGRPLIKGGI